MTQLSFWPMLKLDPTLGRIALRDEGGKLVRVDMYTSDGERSLSVDVPRERLLSYAKQMLEAGLRPG